MAKASHTPGPWKVREFETIFQVLSEDGLKVVNTSWHSRIRHPYPLKEEARANARLISAATDMSEALLAAPIPSDFQTSDAFLVAYVGWLELRSAALTKAHANYPTLTARAP